MDVLFPLGMAGTIHYLSEMANPQTSCFPAFELWPTNRPTDWTERRTGTKRLHGYRTNNLFVTFCLGWTNKIEKKINIRLELNRVGAIQYVGRRRMVAIFPVELDAPSCVLITGTLSNLRHLPSVFWLRRGHVSSVHIATIYMMPSAINILTPWP